MTRLNITESLYKKYRKPLKEEYIYDDFDPEEFEKEIPHEMRYKVWDTFGDNVLYWVTQEPYDAYDLEQFKKAMKFYGVPKALVILRDYSHYDWRDDMESDDADFIDISGQISKTPSSVSSEIGFQESCSKKLNESSYSEPLFERIEEALYESGLNVTRFNEAGLMTNNLGWVVSDDDGNEVQMECLGTW